MLRWTYFYVPSSEARSDLVWQLLGLYQVEQIRCSGIEFYMLCRLRAMCVCVCVCVGVRVCVCVGVRVCVCVHSYWISLRCSNFDLYAAWPDPHISHISANLITFFVSAPSEINFSLLVDQTHKFTFSRDAKKRKNNLSNIFTCFPKKLSLSKNPKAASNHVSWIKLTHAISSATLHNSIIIKRGHLNISHFFVIFTSFIQYVVCFVFYIKFPGLPKMYI